MFCALTTPSPDDRTDLGEMLPLMTLIKANFVSLDGSAAGAEGAMMRVSVSSVINEMVEITLRTS